MKRAEKAARILAILDELYPDPQIPLDHQDPFTLLVAVVLSAQTTDVRVNLVTPALFARADSPAKMARMSPDEIHALIKTCGLAPGKAKNLHALSKILVEQHGGDVPRTFEELEALPGVGHKSASVVMVQAFGVPAFPVDTHIHRLAHRWGLSRGKNVEETERDLKAVFPEDAWSRAHIEIILFGREHCPALRHDMDACPICSWAASPKLRAASKPARSKTTLRAAKTPGRAANPPVPAPDASASTTRPPASRTRPPASTTQPSARAASRAKPSARAASTPAPTTRTTVRTESTTARAAKTPSRAPKASPSARKR